MHKQGSATWYERSRGSATAVKPGMREREAHTARHRTQPKGSWGTSPDRQRGDKAERGAQPLFYTGTREHETRALSDTQYDMALTDTGHELRPTLGTGHEKQRDSTTVKDQARVQGSA
ncbi:hypothetical protein NDU88_007191 [Pleurodeles waltl]|uniref:Uncharacterized protein n=1 Tax=Pleurodeles waltl TaxID=8319 RepID=A0AAV7NVL1_PLEWA|nr:hypothetical protein NDU88_007191 [Pleurodeles waltl]